MWVTFVGFLQTIRSPLTILLAEGSHRQSPVDPAALKRLVSAIEAAGANTTAAAPTTMSKRAKGFMRSP